MQTSDLGETYDNAKRRPRTSLFSVVFIEIVVIYCILIMLDDLNQCHMRKCFFFKWPKNALKPSGWGNIYGRQFYTTQLRVSNFRCLELLSDPQRIQHNEAGLYMKFYALRKYDQRRKLTKNCNYSQSCRIKHSHSCRINYSRSFRIKH